MKVTCFAVKVYSAVMATVAGCDSDPDEIFYC